MDTQPFDNKPIRNLLTAAFDDETLQDFCMDYFPPVYENFATGQSKGARIRALMDYCSRYAQLDQLLVLLQNENPEQYQRFAPYHRQANPSPDSYASQTNALTGPQKRQFDEAFLSAFGSYAEIERMLDYIDIDLNTFSNPLRTLPEVVKDLRNYATKHNKLSEIIQGALDEVPETPQLKQLSQTI